MASSNDGRLLYVAEMYELIAEMDEIQVLCRIFFEDPF
jgi:hypothetical protein